MSKLDKIMPDYRNQGGRTPHDMSHGIKMTCACGHINPVEDDIVLPGDSVYLGFDFIARNRYPFLAPASADIDFHVDYFFVPMELIYKPFASLIYGVKDEYSSFFTSKNITLPAIQWGDVYTYFYNHRQDYQSVGDNISNTPFECAGKRFLRLMQGLGYRDYFPSSITFTDRSIWTANYQDRYFGPYLPSVFPANLLAYNCIYEYYFRLEEREEFDQSIFNFDQHYLSSTVALSSWSTDAQKLKMFGIKYRSAYKDYFNSIRKSPLLNERNLLKTLAQSSNSLVSSPEFLSNNYISATGRFVGSNGLETGDYSDVLANSKSSLANRSYVTDSGEAELSYPRTTDQLRVLFANEKLLMITARARKNYDAQTLAHFGFKVPHDPRHQITHIGHQKATMHIGEITALADASEYGGTPFGAYAGRGMAALKSKRHKFTAPCHGVIMTTLSIVPRYDYFTGFLKKNLLQNRLNFFQPEYDHLGMQPLYFFECWLPDVLSTSTIKSVEQSIIPGGNDSPNYWKWLSQRMPNDAMMLIQGWQFRYEENHFHRE